MSRIAVFPEAMVSSVRSVLDVLGTSWKAFDRPADLLDGAPETGWELVIAQIDADPTAAFDMLSRLRNDDHDTNLFVLTSADFLGELSKQTHLFDDFCLTPFHPAELQARLDHILTRTGGGEDASIITYGPLSLNVETYQAVIEGRALDLTYMEYELLRYLASDPGKVFSREILLSDVWGYDYYGGARTVDVHIRRLRSKLGEEHASLITTVRSVGYRFGTARWS